MNQDLQVKQDAAVVNQNTMAAVEQLLAKGDLAALTVQQRVEYYNKLCASLGLNPLTRPFEYMTLKGKLVMYAKKDAAEQLRKLHGVSTTITSKTIQDGLYIVTVRATIGSRTDESSGILAIQGMRGEELANAMMKAETKAKRRATLSICGLGILDETEIDDTPNARNVSEEHIKQEDEPKALEGEVVEETKRPTKETWTHLRTEASKKGWDDTKIGSYMKRNFRVQSSTEMNMAQFKELFEIVKTKTFEEADAELTKKILAEAGGEDVGF